MTRYLEGPEAELKENLYVFHGFVGRLHQVHEHHVVDPEQRDQQEGGFRQTPGNTHAHAGRWQVLQTLCAVCKQVISSMWSLKCSS